jgi:hypothetical protein
VPLPHVSEVWQPQHLNVPPEPSQQHFNVATEQNGLVLMPAGSVCAHVALLEQDPDAD